MPPKTFAPLALEATDLACRRDGRVVFTGVSFRLERGHLLAATGPNGSGKSSLLRVLAGLLAPAAGAFRIEGTGEDQAVTHYVGHSDALKAAMTLRETLRFWAAVYRQQSRVVLDPDFDDEAAEAVGLRHALEFSVGVLSAGQRRRAGLARLLLSPRPLWLLDEPTASLDRGGEAVVAAMITKHLSAGGLVVAATHQDLPVAANATIDLSSCG
jgi:heme exporter protein A